MDMDNKEIINFSKFFENDFTPKLSEFNKDNFKDFFISEDKTESTPKVLEEPELDDSFDPPVDVEEFVIDEETPDELEVEDSLRSYQNKNNYTKVKESSDNYFSLYKDKLVDFSCDVMVEGAKLNDTEARLIIESDDWTLMFTGEIDRDGRCNIPIKKLNIFQEGTLGKIRLEVIAENTVFIPWEDDFKVRVSKKVTVQFNESKYNKKGQTLNESKVKVNVRR